MLKMGLEALSSGVLSSLACSPEFVVSRSCSMLIHMLGSLSYKLVKEGSPAHVNNMNMLTHACSRVQSCLI